MKKILFFVSILIAGTLTANQPGETTGNPLPSAIQTPPVAITLTGNVIDNETGESLAGARIEIEETGEEFFTDIFGNFTIKAPNAESYTLKVSYISYKEKEITCKTTCTQKNQVISMLPL